MTFWQVISERIAKWARPRIRQIALVPFVLLGLLVLLTAALMRLASSGGW